MDLSRLSFSWNGDRSEKCDHFEPLPVKKKVFLLIILRYRAKTVFALIFFLMLGSKHFPPDGHSLKHISCVILLPQR